MADGVSADRTGPDRTGPDGAGDRKHDLPNFNLDSDRGYGYLVWKQPWDERNSPERLIVQPKDDDDAGALEQTVVIKLIDKDD